MLTFNSKSVGSVGPSRNSEQVEEHQPNESPAQKSTYSEMSTGWDLKVNTLALEGVRGLMSLVVMFSHVCDLTRFHTYDLGASWLMPLFFFLSGFVLGIQQGQQKWESAPCFNLTTPQDRLQFNTADFIWRRLSRLMPVLYLSFALCVPMLVLHVQKWLESCSLCESSKERTCPPCYPVNFNLSPSNVFFIFTNLTCTSSWFLPIYPILRMGHPFPFIEPSSWFVASIFFCYWCLPPMLTTLQGTLQRLSHKRKVQCIWGCYVLQIALCYLVIHSLPNGNVDSWLYSTMWPVTRVPVFFMGVLTGMLRNADHLTCWKDIFEGVTPSYSKGTEHDSPAQWGRVVDITWASAVVMYVGLDLVIRQLTRRLDTFNLELYFFMPILCVQFTYGLTCDQRHSLAAKVCLTSQAQLLGKMSYSLYLLHTVVAFYVMAIFFYWVNKAVFERRDSTGVLELDVFLPVWLTPVVCVLSISLSWFVHVTVEEPARKWMNEYSPFRSSIGSTDAEHQPNPGTSLLSIAGRRQHSSTSALASDAESRNQPRAEYESI